MKGTRIYSLQIAILLRHCCGLYVVASGKCAVGAEIEGFFES